MKTRILKILIPLLIIIVAAIYGLSNRLPSTAFAVGDLTVNWGLAGVGNVGPIFTIADMAPGQTETKTVNIDNGASTARPVAVRGVLTNDLGGLANVMDIVISNSGGDLYGGTTGTKTLADFFADSADPSGIDLFTLNTGQDEDIDFRVTFLASAGNPYQGQSIVFDIKIGIGFDMPAGCEGIIFAGDPIFGTSGNDNLNGGNGNQIIVGLEGNDTINGGNGQDCLIGGPGNDNLNGGNDGDVIDGSDGNDTISGGNGDDILLGGDGVDNLIGGNGDDSIDGQGDNDTMFGGNGNDNLSGGDGDSDKATGGNGIDTCSAETILTCEF